MKIDPTNLSRRDIYALLASAVVPRPIAFVSTVGEDGVFNVAPFSFFTAICTKPALIGFNINTKRDGQKKDTLVNIEFSKDFVINIVTETIAEAMSQASTEYPGDVDEFQEVGLTPAKSDLVKPPMVAESPVNMECKLVQILEFGEPHRRAFFTIGEIVQIHIKDELWAGGNITAHKLKAIGRLGEDLYCRTTDIFEMKRPFITG